MTVLAAYGGVFTFVVSVIAVGYQPPQPSTVNTPVANAAVQTPVATIATPDLAEPSVDDLVAINVAGKLAERTNMAVTPYIASKSTSLAIQADLSQTSSSAIVKPEIAQLADTNTDITTYIVQKGDTLRSIASKFGLTVQTLQWANNMTSSHVSTGQKLTIPPVDGVIYTVRPGDTIENVASTYRASKDRIVSVNNLEISGLKPGTKIVIPGGNLPTSQRPGYQAPAPTTSSLAYFRAGSVGNRYAPGNCTWYAYEYRAKIGRPIGSFWGDAQTWDDAARASGYRVDHTPKPGAIAQWDSYAGGSGWYGHVAIVKSVNANGSITIVEMNYLWQFNQITERTIWPGEVSNFIH